MNAEQIRELNEKCQAKAQKTNTDEQRDAALVSLELSLLAELTAQVAERNENRATLRDQFAMAAVTGMLADPNVQVAGVAEVAYKVADQMLKARKK